MSVLAFHTAFGHLFQGIRFYLLRHKSDIEVDNPISAFNTRKTILILIWGVVEVIESICNSGCISDVGPPTLPQHELLSPASVKIRDMQRVHSNA